MNDYLYTILKYILKVSTCPEIDGSLWPRTGCSTGGDLTSFRGWFKGYQDSVKPWNLGNTNGDNHGDFMGMSCFFV